MQIVFRHIPVLLKGEIILWNVKLSSFYSWLPAFCTENNVYLTKDDLRPVIPVLYLDTLEGGSLKDLFYIYKFRLLQIQEFRTLSIFIPISCLLIIHSESWAGEIKNHKGEVLRKLERSNCVPSFPQVGILVPVYKDYLFLTKEWALLASLHDPHREQVVSLFYPFTIWNRRKYTETL